MFGILRNHTKTIVAILISLIIPAFVLWGVSSAVISRKANFAGKVWNERVTIKEFNQALAAVELDAAMTYGENYKAIVQYLDLKNLAWERILLIKNAIKNGFTVTDTELIDHIHALPYFQNKGVFSKERYFYLLNSFFKLTPEQFEERTRYSMLVQKRVQKIRSSVSVTDQELLDAYKVLKEQMIIDYVVFKDTQFTSDIAANDAALQTYFEAHKGRFQIGTQRQIAYASVDPQTLPTTEVSNEQALQYYNDNIKLYTTKDEESGVDTIKPFESVRSSIDSILKTDQQEAQAYEQANALAEALLDQIPFDQIQNDHGITFTQTPFLTTSGTIPGIQSGRRLMQNAFQLQIGESSDVIKTFEGYFVIKVLNEKAPYIPEFKDIANKVRDAYTQTKSAELAQAAAQNMRNKITALMRSKNISFNEATTELKLSPATSDAFTQNAPVNGLGYIPALNEASFRLKIGEVSQVIKGSGRSIVFSPSQRIPVSQEAFQADKTKDDFAKRTLNQKQLLIYNTWMKDLKTQANVSPNPKYFKPQA